MGAVFAGLKALVAAPAVMGAPAVLAAESSADLTTFFGFGTSALTWLITCFGTVLNFMLANPICFIGLIFSLIGTAFVYLRATIGG